MKYNDCLSIKYRSYTVGTEKNICNLNKPEYRWARRPLTAYFIIISKFLKFKTYYFYLMRFYWLVSTPDVFSLIVTSLKIVSRRVVKKQNRLIIVRTNYITIHLTNSCLFYYLLIAIKNFLADCTRIIFYPLQLVKNSVRF